MQELRLPEKLKKGLQVFTQKLKEIYQHDLVSVILYGSAASNEFSDKISNLNILCILKSTELRELKKASSLINKFPTVNALFLNQDYIANSLDIFPIEFLDMKENYSLLYGEDVLSNINVDTKNLRFQCEQELKAKLINLRQAYLRMNRDKTGLRNLLLKSFTSVLHILRNVLRLKGKIPPYKKEDILKDLGSEFNIDMPVWDRILAVKQKKLRLNAKESESLFIYFVSELESIVTIVDKL
jgi:predicted nucleotidyltransferase